MDCSLPGSSVHVDSPGENTGVDCQGIFPTQGSHQGLLHCSWILYRLSHQGSPRKLEWVAYPFSRSFWSRNQTGVSCIAGGFFTSWATREAIYHMPIAICVSLEKYCWSFLPSFEFGWLFFSCWVIEFLYIFLAAAAAKSLQSCPTLRPQRQQPTRLPCPWDSPGKNTGVGCHLLLQCMKVKSESEVAQLCLTLSDPMDCSLPVSSVHGIFQARVLEWGAIAFSDISGY